MTESICERYLAPEIAQHRWQECLKILNLDYELDQINHGALSTYICQLKQNEINVDGGFGKGQGVQSQLSAQFEALEHYLSYDEFLPHSHKQLFSLRELKKHNFNFLLNDPEPYLFEAIGENKKIYWNTYHSLLDQNAIFVPLAFSDPTFSNTAHCDELDYSKINFLSTNNGCAIGCSVTEATIHGLLELIERDAISRMLISSFLLNNNIKLLNMETIPPALRTLVRSVEEITGHQIIIFPLPSKFNVPAFGAYLRHTTPQNTHPIVGFGASLINEYAVERAVLECLQMYSLQQERKIKVDTLQYIDNYPMYKKIMQFNLDDMIEHSQFETVEYKLPTTAFFKNCSSEDYLKQIVRQITVAGIHPYRHIAAEFDNGIAMVKTFIPKLEVFYSVLMHGYPAVPQNPLLYYTNLPVAGIVAPMWEFT